MGILSMINNAVMGYVVVRETVNGIMSKGIDTFGNLVPKFSMEIKRLIQEKLKKTIKKNTLSLLLYIGALLISYFAFPNKTVATYITSIILLVVLATTVIRVIKLIIKYHYYIFCLIRNRFKLFDSIVYYVRCKKGTAAKIAMKILSILVKSHFIKDSTIKQLKRQVVKSALGIAKIMVADLIFFAVYMIVVSKVVRPMLLDNMVGLTSLQLYIYPFVKSIDFIFHTSLCSFFGISI
ncbi:MAG: hypothetical protein HDT42_08115 [Ruminococcaceae bacterium]|nr:hypothetical protein [Oscillospiraceae bacterium]